MPRLTKDQYEKLREKGLDDDRIKTLAAQRGYDMPDEGGIVTDFVKGAAKGFVGDIARPTAQMLQGIGQRAIAAATPATLDEVRAETGFKSLDDNKVEGQAVVNALKTDSASETAGRVTVNVASFFVPTSPAIQAAGRAAQTAGRVTARAGIGLSAKEAPLMQAYKARVPVSERIAAALKNKDIGRPITNSETALKKGLWGTESMIGVQAKRAANNIWQDVIAPALKSSPEKVNMTSFIDELAGQIDEIPELTRRSELKEALSAFTDDYGKVGEVGMEQLQKFKEGWAKFVPDKAYNGRPIAGSFREIQNMAASLARNKIYNALTDIEGKAAYFDYGNLKNLQAMGQKAMTGAKLKGGAGSFVSGLYDKVVTPVATTGGLALYRVGEGMEFVGRQGARVLGDLFK